MSLTSAQEAAVKARGNVLVIAGAGTGKTRTLVERCIRILLEDPARVSIDEILMVTFTEAAAAEMRQRIRSRLEEQAKACPDAGRWREQLALFETAHIGTLHSFCLKLIREHFYQLALDPQLSVLTEEDAHTLAAQTLDELLEEHYKDGHPLSEKLQTLVQEYGRGSDLPVRQLILSLHRYAQSLPDSGAWIRQQLEAFSDDTAALWRQWLQQAFEDWRSCWTPALQAAGAAGNGAAARALAVLQNLNNPVTAEDQAIAIAGVQEAFNAFPPRQKTAWRKPFETFLKEVEFLASLLPPDREADALREDWNWVRPHMSTLLTVAAEFTGRYADAKRELGMADFQDLEQHTLRLLWEIEANQPTAIARHWRERLKFIFVDEYQDINAAQDKIIEALSRPGAHANRFLVGDVKQSIYRFRLANPAIFQAYAAGWRGAQGTAIALRENFRSREGILRFANALFSSVMRPETGGVAYDMEAQLEPGQPCKYTGAVLAGAHEIPVEFRVRVKSGGAQATGEGSGNTGNENGETGDSGPELEEADKEARLVAARLRELHDSGYPVWDDSLAAFRPVRWNDMAILLRSPSGKAESYAKNFGALGLPLVVARGGFYSSLEVTDLLSALEILDNPFQDIPLLAVLRSPLVGLTASELATLRLASLKTKFWTAVLRWHQAQVSAGARTGGGVASPLFARIDSFLIRFRRWRRLARQVPLSRCLELILGDTHYTSWLLTQSRSEMRQANVKRLLAVARRFDQFQRQGLFRFLRYMELQRESDTEPAAAAASQSEAVRLMSVHQSKGLEFPVVVVPDMAKQFNFSDTNEQIILDEHYGLCPVVRPPDTGASYPSLAFWMARRRQTRELLGEELRLLYVAVTRARDLLVLVGTVSERKWDAAPGLPPPDISALLRVRCYSDWLLPWFARSCGPNQPIPDEGENELLRWRVCREHIVPRSAGHEAAVGHPVPDLTPEDWRALQAKLAGAYPHLAATRQPAKASVTSLRGRLETDAVTLHWPQAPAQGRRPAASRGRLSAAETGNAHHAFLEAVSLDRVGTIAELKEEAERLKTTGVLSAEEIAALDYEGLLAFWNSGLGRTIRSRTQWVRRELAFTVRLPANELSALAGQGAGDPSLASESVVLQGVADLVLLEPGGITLVDFKTDQLDINDVPARAGYYAPQLRLYATALSRIYGAPVQACWLYFLRVEKAVQVPLTPARTETAPCASEQLPLFEA